MIRDGEYPRLARRPLMRAIPEEDPVGAAASPEELRKKYERLAGQREAMQRQRESRTKLLRETEEFLVLAPAVEAALERLSEEMFGRLSAVIERHQTLALQEVLRQPITLKIERDFKAKRSTMRFYVERDGQAEDIMRGQGGSVANILSVGLRIFALTQLDRSEERRVGKECRSRWAP